MCAANWPIVSHVLRVWCAFDVKAKTTNEFCSVEGCHLPPSSAAIVDIRKDILRCVANLLQRTRSAMVPRRPRTPLLRAAHTHTHTTICTMQACSTKSQRLLLPRWGLGLQLSDSAESSLCSDRVTRATAEDGLRTQRPAATRT